MITSNAGLLITRGSTVISDLIVLTVTVQHVVPNPWSLLKVTHRRQPFAHILLRDGLLYFATLTMLSVIEIFLGQFLVEWMNAVPPFISMISTIFVSRFILDLRVCAASPVVGLGSTESLTLGDSISSSLVFAEFSHITPMELPDATLDELGNDGDADDDDRMSDVGLSSCGDETLSERQEMESRRMQ
ncbi:uncharacterized protein C8Q71DRAFT_788777 [Rhodofomes roseus]|uniref:CNNM transmembrane domain-containing protein n=1 Tax=Rhodofomes roseus TaxID=34475 RepID=A0ABQ8JZQ6_9APHY|nr:uncharacterized protein C8Q71DRAFT_788777 [Rhodofomes roseus]KAH9829856.1 hypothetical protein C8Q71DRAFT_788777 [Rhodofomes roseus]